MSQCFHYIIYSISEYNITSITFLSRENADIKIFWCQNSQICLKCYIMILPWQLWPHKRHLCPLQKMFENFLWKNILVALKERTLGKTAVCCSFKYPFQVHTRCCSMKKSFAISNKNIKQNNRKIWSKFSSS